MIADLIAAADVKILAPSRWADLQLVSKSSRVSSEKCHQTQPPDPEDSGSVPIRQIFMALARASCRQ